jgi:cytoskeletal protein CcmA (bactofilin family)
MWTNKYAQFDPLAAPSPRLIVLSTSYLGPGLQIKGEITGHEDLKLDSKVEGLVSIGGFRFTVGPSAHVAANIVAREAVISGEVTGDITARDRIEIKAGASIMGALSTGKIMIEEGAHFKGTIDIDRKNNQIGTHLGTLLKGDRKTEVS